MSSKVVVIAETATNIPILVNNQCHVADDEDIENIVESSTAVPANIDEMGPPEKRKPSTAGTLNIDKMGLVEKKTPLNADTVDIDKLGPPEKRKPQQGSALLEVSIMMNLLLKMKKRVMLVMLIWTLIHREKTQMKYTKTLTLFLIRILAVMKMIESFPLPSPVAKKATKKKNAVLTKTIPHSSFTCDNAYFRVINVYMSEQHRSDVLMLGQPPTMAGLDTRKFSRHKYIFDRLNYIP